MECGECTLCCELLPVPSINKQAHELCKYCTENKCSIYETRPKECAEFRCAFHQMDRVSIDLRPDKCKVIFEKISDNIFFGTQDPKFEMTEVAKKQIVAFNNQGYSVIIATKDMQHTIYVSSKHTPLQIYTEFKKYLETKHDSTFIHNRS